MEYNKQFIKEILQDIIKTSLKAEFVYAVVFYQSPMNEELTYRVAYFKEHIERELWCNEVKKFYDKNRIDYLMYVGYGRIYKLY